MANRIMKRCLMTVCTSDRFQHYIPPFYWAARLFLPSDIDVVVYIRGEPDDVVDGSMNYGNDCSEKVDSCNLFVASGTALDYPNLTSTTNALRFVISDMELMKYDRVLITDIDLMLFKDPFPWHENQMKVTGKPFAGHHGPWKYPERPEICNGWAGAFERVAGGFFMVTKEWWEKTAEARSIADQGLMSGSIGRYRENDETMLGNIIKRSGMSVPSQKGFPAELRGLHLGDFKSSMKHRWTNIEKMRMRLTYQNCKLFMEMIDTPYWREYERFLNNASQGQDIETLTIIENVLEHIRLRGDFHAA